MYTCDYCLTNPTKSYNGKCPNCGGPLDKLKKKPSECQIKQSTFIKATKSNSFESINKWWRDNDDYDKIKNLIVGSKVKMPKSKWNDGGDIGIVRTVQIQKEPEIAIMPVDFDGYCRIGHLECLTIIDKSIENEIKSILNQ